MKCSIVIVNYKSKKYLSKCLQSIEKQLIINKKPVFPFEIIVVNNDPKETISTKNNPLSLRVLNNPNNIGYGGANNIGAQLAFGQYLFFLNPDTILLDDSLKDMIYHLDKHQDVGIIGPTIFDYYRKAPQPWTCGSKTDLLNIIFRNTINKPWNKKRSMNVDWVSGTALLTRKKLFQQIGGFDERFFMYFEDQDLCLRIKNSGKAVIYCPHSKVIHFDGKSWNDKSSKKSAFFESQTYFFQKHHGQFQSLLLNSLRIITKGK